MLSQANPDTGLTSLQEAMQPWATPDLMTYCMAIGLMFAEVEQYACDQTDGTPGWTTFLDVDRCPTAGLPFLGQWIGSRVPDGLTDAAARAWIKGESTQLRGTPNAIAAAAQRFLTGTQIVQIAERQDGSGAANNDWISVQVFAAQCPNVGLVLGELRKAVPADVQFAFNQMTGATWLSVKNQNTTWAAVKAANTSWTQVGGGSGTWLSWETPTS